MSNKPDPLFERLAEIFNKATDIQNIENAALRAVRALSLDGKTAMERGMQQFPQPVVVQKIEDIYALLGDPAAGKVSSGLDPLNEETIKKVLDTAALRMQDRATALAVAAISKEILGKVPDAQLEMHLQHMMQSRPANERMLAQVLFSQIVRPALRDVRDSSVEDAADTLALVAQNMPRAFIAAQINSVIRRQTAPEKMSRQAKELLGKLPTPQEIADVAFDIGNAGVAHLDRAALSNSPGEALDIFRQFARHARNVVAKAAEKRQPPKRDFGKKSGDFSL